MDKENEEIFLDLDRNRIKNILAETYIACQELLSIKFNISSESFVCRISPYLDSNRIAIPVFVGLPSAKYPGLKIEVDLRRKKVFARMPNRKKQALLNHYLKVL